MACTCCPTTKALRANPALVRIGWTYQTRIQGDRTYLVYTLDHIEYVSEDEAWQRTAELIHKAFRSVSVREGDHPPGRGGHPQLTYYATPPKETG